MMGRRFINLLFQKQPVERDDDALAVSLRDDVAQLKRTLSSVEKTIEELLDQRDPSGKKRNAPDHKPHPPSL